MTIDIDKIKGKNVQVLLNSSVSGPDWNLKGLAAESEFSPGAVKLTPWNAVLRETMLTHHPEWHSVACDTHLDSEIIIGILNLDTWSDDATY